LPVGKYVGFPMPTPPEEAVPGLFGVPMELPGVMIVLLGGRIPIVFPGCAVPTTLPEGMSDPFFRDRSAWSPLLGSGGFPCCPRAIGKSAASVTIKNGASAPQTGQVVAVSASLHARLKSFRNCFEVRSMP
jgi:hypothetical protein